MIQTLRERHQQSSDVESDSEIENELEQISTYCYKKLLAKNDHQKQLKTSEKKSEKKRIYELLNDSNFDDTG